MNEHKRNNSNYSVDKTSGVIDMETHNALLDYLIIVIVLALGVILTSMLIRAMLWAPVILSSVSWNA
jgi:hypothetical protein